MTRSLLFAVVALTTLLAASGCAKECPACALECPEQKDCPACNCPAAKDCPACTLTCPEIPAPSEPKVLPTYADLYRALRAGKNVRVVLDYSKCTLNGAGTGPEAFGAMPLDVYEWFAAGVVGNTKAYFSFSSAKLIKLGANYRYNYVKVRVFEDNKLSAEAEYVDPAAFTTAMHEVFDCKLTKDAATLDGATLWQY